MYFNNNVYCKYIPVRFGVNKNTLKVSGKTKSVCVDDSVSLHLG